MIVVIGGTGQVGRQVVTQLTERGLPVRSVSRGLNPGAVPPGAEAVRADLADPASLEAHLLDAQSLFLLWPFTSPEVTAGLVPKVAEIAARLRLPAAVTKVLVSDLADCGAVRTAPPRPGSDTSNRVLLERLLDGLQRRL